MFGSSTFSKREGLCNQKFVTVAMYFLLTLCLFRICFLLLHSILSADLSSFFWFHSLLVFSSYVYFFYLILFEFRLWYWRLIPVIPDSTVLQTFCCSYHTRLQYHHDEQLDIVIHFILIFYFNIFSILIYFILFILWP